MTGRQKSRQLRGLFGAIAVVQRLWRETSRSMNGHVETCRAMAGGIRQRTQNPPAYGLTSSSLVPGIALRPSLKVISIAAGDPPFGLQPLPFPF